MIRALLLDLLGLRSSSPENPSTSLANPAKWLLDLVGGGRAASGVAVTEERALAVAVAYSCASLLAGTIASLPLHVYRRTGKFAAPAPEHWAQALLSEAPNELQTAYAWRETMMLHALLWGNHYTAMDLGRNGEVTFLPLLPWNVRVRLTSSGMRKVYVARLSDGSEKIFREDQVLHVPALSCDGLTGISPVRNLRNMYGLAIATEDFGSRFFANDARPGVILETPKSMSPEASKNLVESLYAKFHGAENRWKVLVLEEGAKMHTVSMPLEDAQFLETRQVEDVRICGSFGVPPVLVGITEKTTAWGTGIEQITLGFVKYTLRRWVEKIEQEFQRKIFSGTEFFAKHNLEGLQRGDYKSRMEGNEIAIRSGQLLIDEVRAFEDRAPLPNGLGAVPLIQSNWQTLERAETGARGGLRDGTGDPLIGDPVIDELRALRYEFSKPRLAVKDDRGRVIGVVTVDDLPCDGATYRIGGRVYKKRDLETKGQ